MPKVRRSLYCKNFYSISKLSKQITLQNLFEAEGRKKESADIMLDVQVETIRNMSRPEKLTILLLQVWNYGVLSAQMHFVFFDFFFV